MANHIPKYIQFSWLIPVKRYKQELKPIKGIKERFLTMAKPHRIKLMIRKKKMEALNSPSSGSLQSIKLWKNSG